MLWRDLRPGDVVHYEKSCGGESYVVVKAPTQHGGFVFVPLVSLDTGELFEDHYKGKTDIVEWP